MLKYGTWDLPGEDYFQAKNSFKGSRDNFRFIVSPCEDGIKASVWKGEKCLELSEIIAEKTFELCEQSLYEINEYLTAQYNSLNS